MHILGVQVNIVQFGATGTRRQGKDFRYACLWRGNERHRELICLSNTHAHANSPRWFHWSTIQVVQCSASQRMPGHCHMRDPSPLSAICVVGAHSGLEVYVESSGVLHSPMQGTPMRLDVYGGGVVDAKAYNALPGLAFNSCAYHGPAHGGGSALPLFSTVVATQITSLMNLLKSYWPMAFVPGATREHRILLVYGRIPPGIRPYTGSMRLPVCIECCMLCPCCMRLCARFRWATGPHMPGTCFCSNYSYNSPPHSLVDGGTWVSESWGPL